MRIKVSYSLDLEEIPDQMIKLGQKVSDLVNKDFKQDLRGLNEALIGQQYIVTGEKIIALKESLIVLDQTISDLGNMLAGYSSIQVQNQVGPEPEPEPYFGGVDAPE
jgi:hypothetical protein